MVERAFEALEKHWNPQYQGYCAYVRVQHTSFRLVLESPTTAAETFAF